MAKLIKLKNYEFNYYSQGNPANPAILFLHGFIGDCHEFNEVISLLSKEFYCLSVDLPGHGKTKVTGDAELYQMAHIAGGLIHFLNALNINQCILTGYSMGGRLAMYTALHFPQYFQKVILESASPGLKTQEERDIRIHNDLRLAEQLETEEFLNFLNRWYEQPLFSSIRRHTNFAMMLERRLQNDPLELSKSLQNLSTGAQPSLWEKLQEYSIPSLLLVGDLDKKFVNINTEICRLCRFAKLEIVKNCGHNIHLENAALFVQILRHFLAVSS